MIHEYLIKIEEKLVWIKSTFCLASYQFVKEECYVCSRWCLETSGALDRMWNIFTPHQSSAAYI